MKTKKRTFFILLSMIFILTLLYFSKAIPFYRFSNSLSSYKMKLEKSTQSKINGQLLWFTYYKNDIYLNINTLLESPQIKLYTLTKDGNKPINSSRSMKLKDEYTGTFVAVAPKLQFDVDNDGQNDTIYAAAKTDTQATQGFVPVNTYYADETLPFELVLTNKSLLTVFYKSKPLANAPIEVCMLNKPSKKITTNEKGELFGININDIRNGLYLKYKDKAGEYYTFSYQVENNSLFTARHLTSMKPIFLIALCCALLIIIVIIIRNRNIKKEHSFHLFLHIKFLLFQITKIFKNIHVTFGMVRWFTMIMSFLLLVYGLRIFGKKITLFELPTFACPQNSDQFIGSSCYTLSHLNTFLLEKKETIITFFATTFLIIILFGRTLCGFICPFGLMQDVIYEIRNLLKVNSIPLTEKTYHILTFFKWLMILIFFGACSIGINFCDFCPAIITSPAFAGFQTSIYMSGFIVIILFVASFFKRRFWCNICPLGFFIGLFHKFSLFRIRKNCQSCTECGACYEACPMGIKSIYTERKKTNITTADCIMCGECVKKCPENDAISMAILKKKFYISSRFQFFHKKKKVKSIKMPFFHKEV